MSTSARRRVVAVVLLAAVLAVVWLVLPQLRFANVDWVAHGDPARAAVAGRALTPDGTPVAGLEVIWSSQDGASGMLGTRLFRGGDLRATTSADGTFRFENVPLAEGYASIDGSNLQHEGHSQSVAPRAGFTATGLALTAETIAPARKLSGQLRSSDGQPIRFTPLVARADRWWRTWQCAAMTDGDGRFELVGPGAGADVELLLRPPSGFEVALGTFACGTPAVVTVPR
jgi:hypothetical protein